MPNNLLNKVTALILAIVLTFSTLLCLVSCRSGNEGNSNSSQNNDASSNGNQNSNATDENFKDKIQVPAYKDFERGTIDFDKITYERPNFESIINSFKDIVEIITINEIPFEEQIQKIIDLEDDYNDVLTMHSIATIYNSKDSSSAFWNAEYEYMNKNYPSFAEVIEDMFVAAANSPFATLFEEQYFGEGLIEKYKDGGKFTDKMIALWKEEETLESKYSSISTATIKITYKDKTDTVDNILKFYADKHGENSTSYLKVYTSCIEEYEKKANEESKQIFVDLIKIRKEIANELGHESYMTYGYEALGRDYSAEDLSKFLNDIAEYVVPIYSALSVYVFTPYFKNNSPKQLSLDTLINESYKMINETDPHLADIYHYMLQHDLYDLDLSKTNRQNGAFTSYLETYNAPFIFMTANGTIADYSTLMHEFGHFSDSFINYNSSTSIDQKEVSSQALEYLMLLTMEDNLGSKDIQYLTYSKLKEALETLIFQGFYAKFEELIYRLPKESINEENLNKELVKAAKLFGLNTEYVNDISVAFVPHIFLYPFYVQSYAVSIIPTLEMYFLETEKSGKGFEAYKAILNRGNTDLTFEQTLKKAGLSSPFEKDILRTISDKIYYQITGKHIYKDSNLPNNLNAA